LHCRKGALGESSLQSANPKEAYMSHYSKAKEALVQDFDALMLDRDKSAHDYLLYAINTALYNLVEALEADSKHIKASLSRIEHALKRQRQSRRDEDQPA